MQTVDAARLPIAFTITFLCEAIMGSRPADSATQKAASAQAQSLSATQASNAASAQTAANQQQRALYGTYNPTTNSYSGGSTSAFLDPNQINQTNLSGSYLNQYNNQSNQLANDTNNAVSATIQGYANRGGGAMPTGFAADQQRQAYAQAAATRGNDYSQALGAQHNEAVQNFWNANNALSSSANTNQASATANNANAAGTNTSLYGTASQPVQSGWGAVLNTVGSLGGAAAGGFGGALGASAAKKICWVAEALYGVDDVRTMLVRAYLTGPFRKRLLGRWLVGLYGLVGESTAAAIRRVPSLGMLFRPLFDCALNSSLEVATWL